MTAGELAAVLDDMTCDRGCEDCEVLTEAAARLRKAERLAGASERALEALEMEWGECGECRDDFCTRCRLRTALAAWRGTESRDDENLRTWREGRG